MKKPGTMTAKQRDELLNTLKDRFEKYAKRHKGVEWADLKARLEAHPEKLSSLWEMESTGGEPDVVGHDSRTGEYTFFDCSTPMQPPNSPSFKRS